MNKISVVLPCHNEKKNVGLIKDEIIKNIPKKYDYELIFVDDGSSDDTDIELAKLSRSSKKIKSILLHKNFGHQLALLAGINSATGDVIITMDSDFQHPPPLLPKAIKYWEQGYDLVQFYKKKDKSASFFSISLRGLGYKIWSWISDGALHIGVSDFRLFDKSLAEYLNQSEERDVFLRGVIHLAAGDVKNVPYSVKKRRYGKSSYTLKMFVEMFTKGLISFSTKPLRVASFFGIIIAVVTSIFLIYDIIRALTIGKRIVEGYATLALLMLILNGFIIFYIGILGEYIGVIFKEVKKRPKYIIKKTYNL